MKEFKIQIEGVSPLRMNRFTDEAKEMADKGGGFRKLNEKDKEEEAWSRAYANDKGDFIIESVALKACILTGARKVKLGRGKASGDMKAILFLKDRQIPLKYKRHPILVEIVVNIPPGKKGAKVVKRFPLFEDWSLEFNLIITDDRFPDMVVENSIREAGMYAGLLDGRPDYGRFIMKSFQKISSD